MIYHAHYVIPITQEPIEDGEILVRDGKIEAVGKDISSALPDEPVEAFGHAAIMPGFVNVHTHLDYTILRGTADNEPFLPWIRHLTNTAKKMHQEDFLASSRLGLLQLVRSGVTAIGDSTYSGAVVQAANEAGLRVIIYQETFGPDPNGEYKAQVDKLKDKVLALQNSAGDKITVGISPHSVYTSTEQLLRLIADLAIEQ